MAFSVPPQVKYISAAPVANRRSPFLVDREIIANSVAGTTLYGAKHPGTLTAAQYAVFAQAISGNKAFKLPTAIRTILQVTGGAVTAAQQLELVALVDGVPALHARGDAVAAAGAFVAGAGGGTAVADATLSVKGTTAANIAAGATSLSIASSGADTQTILVGDIISITGDATVYRATATSTALNGTTEVLLPITPPLQAAVIAGTAVAVATSDDRTILFGTAPALGAKIEIFSIIATDIVTLTGGAMTAGRDYEIPCYDFMHTAGNVSIQVVAA